MKTYNVLIFMNPTLERVCQQMHADQMNTKANCLCYLYLPPKWGLIKRDGALLFLLLTDSLTKHSWTTKLNAH